MMIFTVKFQFDLYICKSSSLKKIYIYIVLFCIAMIQNLHDPAVCNKSYIKT